MSKEEINRVNEILSCDNCPTSYACEGCDITQSDKLLIKKYISELEISNNELDKENNRLEKIEFERDKANKIINEMAKSWKQDDYRSIEEIIKHFEKKVEGK